MKGFESFIGVDPWTALFILLNTLTIFFVGKKYLFGPVMKLITDRQKEIDEQYRDAGSAKKDAEALRDEYRQKLADAQATSDCIVKEAVARGQAREEEILRKANADAGVILSKVSADIAREKKKAIHDAKNEISGLAMAIAGKVVERELNEDDHIRLIDAFLDGLGDDL